MLLADRLDAWLRSLAVPQIVRGFLLHDVAQALACPPDVARAQALTERLLAENAELKQTVAELRAESSRA